MFPTIKEVEERASDAFWAAVAESFPSIKTGDFPPDAELAWSKAYRNAIATWLGWNLDLGRYLEERFPVGTIVVFTSDVHVGVTNEEMLIAAGERATVVDVGSEVLSIRLDTVHPQLLDWSNHYHWNVTDFPDAQVYALLAEVGSMSPVLPVVLFDDEADDMQITPDQARMLVAAKVIDRTPALDTPEREAYCDRDYGPLAIEAALRLYGVMYP